MRKIKRIIPPKFRVGRNVLNEYELRGLMLEVAEGKRKPGIEVRDQKGRTSVIEPDGALSRGGLYGLDICSGFTLGLIRLRRERREK